MINVYIVTLDYRQHNLSLIVHASEKFFGIGNLTLY